MSTKYVNRWGYMISANPALPGVWRRKEGGFLVRGRATDPRTKKQHEVMRTVDGDDPAPAYQELQALLATIRNPATETTTGPSETRFCDYATSLLARKIQRGEIKGAKTREKWASTLERHLFPAFGKMPVAAIRRADVMQWFDAQAARVRRPGEGKKTAAGARRYSPRTVNGWLAILRVIVGSFVAEYELDRNPVAGVKDLDASEHPTYTDEEPNALTLDEARAFLAKFGELHPQHFAMVALGFATGLRPSSLRPLRRSGPETDLLWQEGVLLVRRSQTRGDEVMNTTKTRHRQRIALPEDLVAILRWHTDNLPEGPMTESILLFPSETGGFRAPSVLDKPFGAVRKVLGLRKHLTPRAMRRTFQDLARAAQVQDVVTRSISGHATEPLAALKLGSNFGGMTGPT